jgi:hypothetical protein
MLKLATYPIAADAVPFNIKFTVPYFEKSSPNATHDLSYSLEHRGILSEGQRLIIALSKGAIEIVFVDSGPPGQSGPNDGDDDEAAE